MSELRIGQVFWLDDCPALDGEGSKRRPVVLVTPRAELLAGADPLVMVAVTTRRPTDPDAVALPSAMDSPACTTGLTERCWAVPRWLLAVPRSRLREPACGYVSRVKLEQLLTAVDRRLDDPGFGARALEGG